MRGSRRRPRRRTPRRPACAARFGEALEPVGYDLGAEVVSAAGRVLDATPPPREAPADALLKFFCARHGFRVPTTTPIQFKQMVSSQTSLPRRSGVHGRPGRRGRHRRPPRRRQGGGCSGFQYALALDEKRDDDHVFEISGIRVIVDPASIQYVDGSTVDFTESFMGSGFEVRTRTSSPRAVAAPPSA